MCMHFFESTLITTRQEHNLELYIEGSEVQHEVVGHRVNAGTDGDKVVSGTICWLRANVLIWTPQL